MDFRTYDLAQNALIIKAIDSLMTRGVIANRNQAIYSIITKELWLLESTSTSSKRRQAGDYLGIIPARSNSISLLTYGINELPGKNDKFLIVRDASHAGLLDFVKAEKNFDALVSAIKIFFHCARQENISGIQLKQILPIPLYEDIAAEYYTFSPVNDSCTIGILENFAVKFDRTVKLFYNQYAERVLIPDKPDPYLL